MPSLASQWVGSLGERKWLTTPTHPLTLLSAWGLCPLSSQVGIRAFHILFPSLKRV